MPWITVETSLALDDTRRDAIAAALTAAMAKLMGKRREVTAVRFMHVPAGAWYVDGRPVNGLHAAVDIKITRGSNTLRDKAALLAAAKAALAPIQEPSYLIIDEVDADAWGYDGRSQASRLFAQAETGG